MNLSERIQQAIGQSGKTQDAIAGETGIPQSSISAMTTGARRPYFDQVVLIAKATGVSVSWLAGEEGEELDLASPPEGMTFDDRLVVRAYRLLKIGWHEAIERLKRPITAAGPPAAGTPTVVPGPGASVEDAEAEQRRAANGEMPRKPKPKGIG